MRGRTSILGIAAAVLTLAAPAAQAAIDWCAIPKIAPRSEADFDRIAPEVERLTGCARQPSTSAHEAKWICADDPATPAMDMVQIGLIRVPGAGANLLVAAVDLDDLGMLRACGDKDLHEGARFVPGNAAHRDQLLLDFTGPALNLANSGPGSVSFLYTALRYGSGGEWADGLMEGAFGIKPVASPATGVRLAGLSPVEVSVEDMVAAFEKRGARVTGTEDAETSVPVWTLSPPVGLAGVKTVKIEAFNHHVLGVTYMLSSTPDYERFVALLDGEYGASSRESDEGCTERWWFSGKASIRGRHCPAGDTIEFTNDVASDQLIQVVAKRKTAQDATPEATKPAIDSDMF